MENYTILSWATAVLGGAFLLLWGEILRMRSKLHKIRNQMTALLLKNDLEAIIDKD